jgi:ATP-dependent Clp protease ATP-binding subunit ClpX
LADARSDKDTEELNKAVNQVKSEDLQQFGLIPEFIGRLPVLAALDPLSEDDLVHILREPKNSLVRQYQKLFKFERVNLTFTDGALRAVAEMASTRRAGARGLRTILENVMLEIMYEIPSRDDIKNLEITEEIIRGEASAFENEDKVPASG